MPRPETPVFEWRAQEHEFDDKPAEWYWALGIVAIASIVACILFDNYLLALVVVTAAVAIGLQAAKEPGMHHFKLSEAGLTIGHRHYSFDLIHSFSVLESIERGRAPMLSIKTNTLLAPHLLIPLVDVDADKVYAFLFSRVEEGEHEETWLDRLSRALRL